MFWLGATVALCYVPGVTGAYIATQWPVMAVLLSFGLLRSGPFTVFHAIGLAFVLYAATRLPYSPAPDASVLGLWLIVIMGLCVWFGTTMTSVKELYAGLAAGAAVSSFLAVLQHFGFTGVQMAGATNAGLYFNGVQQGAVLALIVVALVSERMWIWVPPLLPGIWLAQSRGAWIVLAVGLLGCSVRRLWAFAAAGIVATFYLLSPLSSSDAVRLYFWHFAATTLKWFGWGPGVFYTVALPRNGTFSLYPEYVHNDALQLLWEYGIGALLPFVIFGYALWRTDAREWPVVFAFAVAGCYSMPLFMPVASFLALVAVGRVLRLHGLACSDSDYRRQHVVSRVGSYAGLGRLFVPVGSQHTAEGC